MASTFIVREMSVMKKQCQSIALPLIFILMALSACSNTSDPSFSLDPMPTATASPNPTPGSQDRVSIERVDKSVLTDDGKTLAYIYFDKPVVLGDSDAAAKINMYFENIYLDWASEGNGEMSESDTISSPGAINSLLESLNHIRENDGDDYLLQPGYSLNHTLRSEVMLSDPDTLIAV